MRWIRDEDFIRGKIPMTKFNMRILTIQDLPDLKFNKCFLGGSDGKLEAIFEYLEGHLEAQGILCANFVTLKNLNLFLHLLKDYGYVDHEVQLIQSAYMDCIGLMKGNNPIFIVRGVKG